MIRCFRVKHIKNLPVPKQLFFWGALFWAGIITFFCLVQLNNVPLGEVTNIDKYVHAFFHFVFTVLWFLFFKKHMKNRSIYKPLMFSFMLSIFFGIGIEILQELYTATRKADVFDVLANMTGAGLSVVVILLLRKNMYLDKI
jgi:VanZ family protein